MGTWRRLADAPSERTEVAATVVGSRIIVVGGFRRDGASVSTVEVLDTATGRWARGPDLPLAVDHAMAATIDGIAYVFGGYLARGGFSPAAFRLDGTAWRPVARLPEARGAGAAVVIGTTAYIAGGVGPNGLAETMLVYDATTDRWSTGPGPPTRREHLGGAAFGGLVYTVGGRTQAGNLTALEAYDPKAGSWSALPGMPTRRGGLAAAAATFAEAEAYDVRTLSWATLPPLPTPRHGLGVVVVGQTLYTLAGGPQPGLFVSAATEAIDLAALGPCASNG